MDGGAWWAAVHEVANSRTQLSDFTFTFTWSLSWDSSFPQLQLGMFSMICLFFSFLPVMLLSEIPKLPTDPPVREFLTVWKFLLHATSPGRVSVPNSCLPFCPLYFVLPPFEENGLPFWVPGVLCQHSEVVLWKSVSIQMIFG